MTKSERIELARELRAEGWSFNKIGERLGVSGACVHYWLQGRGMPAQAARTAPATLAETACSVLRQVTILGWAGSGTCVRRSVSVPRLKFLEPAHAH